MKNNSKNAGTMNKTNNTIDLTLNNNKNNNNKKVASEKPIEKKLTKQNNSCLETWIQKKHPKHSGLYQRYLK